MELVTSAPTVFLVDEDAGSVQSILSMLEPTGLPLRWFAFPSEFLEDYCEDTRGCLILDLCRPGEEGLDVLERIAAKGANLPTIVITGDGGRRRAGLPSFPDALRGDRAPYPAGKERPGTAGDGPDAQGNRRPLRRHRTIGLETPTAYPSQVQRAKRG
jgi:CheY-like chemotaxis protein